MGLRMMSRGVPSGRKGMSSAGRMRAITPLLPCLPASLSPTETLRFWAIHTLTSLLTPSGSSSRFDEGLHCDDQALLAMGYSERSVLHLPGLLTEDNPEELLLGGQLRLTLGGDLAYQDVP